jgi:uncharacterized lipoprotein YajG
MKLNRLMGSALIAAVACFAITGCQTEPEVVTTPGSTTVVHDKPAAPNVVVTPSAPSTHTDTHTTTTVPPDSGAATTNTSTTTG